MVTIAAGAPLSASAAFAASAYAAPGCRTDYAVTNQWSGGFGASVTINNTGRSVTW